MKRYRMYGNYCYGEVTEIEHEEGEWVKFDDVPEYDLAYSHACKLAEEIFHRYHSHSGQSWQPTSTLVGVLLQLEYMLFGGRKSITPP